MSMVTSFWKLITDGARAEKAEAGKLRLVLEEPSFSDRRFMCVSNDYLDNMFLPITDSDQMIFCSKEPITYEDAVDCGLSFVSLKCSDFEFADNAEGGRSLLFPGAIDVPVVKSGYVRFFAYVNRQGKRLLYKRPINACYVTEKGAISHNAYCVHLTPLEPRDVPLVEKTNTRVSTAGRVICDHCGCWLVSGEHARCPYCGAPLQE